MTYWQVLSKTNYYLSVLLVSDEGVDSLGVLSIGDGSELVIHYLNLNSKL